MNDIFQIYIDRLKESEQVIDGSAPFDFLDINEKELKMNSAVSMKGKAYLSDNFLIVNLTAKTQYQKPCIICNNLVTLELILEDFYHTAPLSEIDKAYNFKEELRTSLLLKIPHFVECNEGNCLQRKTLEKYIKKTKEQYFPFESLKK